MMMTRRNTAESGSITTPALPACAPAVAGCPHPRATGDHSRGTLWRIGQAQSLLRARSRRTTSAPRRRYTPEDRVWRADGRPPRTNAVAMFSCHPGACGMIQFLARPPFRIQVTARRTMIRCSTHRAPYGHVAVARDPNWTPTRMGYAPGSTAIRSASRTAAVLSWPRADRTSSTLTPRVSGEKGVVSGAVT